MSTPSIERVLYAAVRAPAPQFTPYSYTFMATSSIN